MQVCKFAGKAAPAAEFSPLYRYGNGSYGHAACSKVLRGREIEESRVRRYVVILKAC